MLRSESAGLGNLLFPQNIAGDGDAYAVWITFGENFLCFFVLKSGILEPLLEEIILISTIITLKYKTLEVGGTSSCVLLCYSTFNMGLIVLQDINS